MLFQGRFGFSLKTSAGSLWEGRGEAGSGSTQGSLPSGQPRVWRPVLEEDVGGGPACGAALSAVTSQGAEGRPPDSAVLPASSGCPVRRSSGDAAAVAHAAAGPAAAQS